MDTPKESSLFLRAFMKGSSRERSSGEMGSHVSEPPRNEEPGPPQILWTRTVQDSPQRPQMPTARPWHSLPRVHSVQGAHKSLLQMANLPSRYQKHVVTDFTAFDPSFGLFFPNNAYLELSQTHFYNLLR